MKKELEEEYVTLFIDMQNLTTNTWRIMIKIKNHHIFKYWDVNNLYGLAMLQKLPVNNFEGIEDTFQFKEDFIKKWRI